MNPQTLLRLRARAMLWASQMARMNPGVVYIAILNNWMYTREETK